MTASPGRTRLTGISSMATRALLADLADDYGRQQGVDWSVESVGGVDAARRVLAGEDFDLVVLASDAIDRLVAAGRVLAASKVDLVRSGVAVAVRSGAPLPDIGSEAALREAVRAAPNIGVSTGPSGVALLQLFQRWGIAPTIVQAPPGVPVGTLVARGEVALGFQQASELMHIDGITVLGPLPPAVQIDTVFSAGRSSGCKQSAAADQMLAFLCSPQAAETKRRHGMSPA